MSASVCVLQGQREHPGATGAVGCLSLTSTVCEAVEGIALVAGALEGAGVVDARVVARPLKGALVDVCKVQREASEPLREPGEPRELSNCRDVQIYVS